MCILASFVSLDSLLSLLLFLSLRGKIILHSLLLPAIGGTFRRRGAFPQSNRVGRVGRGFGPFNFGFNGTRGRDDVQDRGRGFGRGRGRSGFLHCTHCGGDNDIIDGCYNLHGKPWENLSNSALFTSDIPSGSASHQEVSALTTLVASTSESIILS